VLIAGLELKKSNPLMNAWMVKEVDAPYQEGIETIDGSHFVVPAGAEGPLRPPEGWAPIKASPLHICRVSVSRNQSLIELSTLLY